MFEPARDTLRTGLRIDSIELLGIDRESAGVCFDGGETDSYEWSVSSHSLDGKDERRGDMQRYFATRRALRRTRWS